MLSISKNNRHSVFGAWLLQERHRYCMERIYIDTDKLWNYRVFQKNGTPVLFLR